MFGNRRHFRVLQAPSEEGIASNILADRLRRLVSAGLLTRADAGRGRRVTYSLTELRPPSLPMPLSPVSHRREHNRGPRRRQTRSSNELPLRSGLIDGRHPPRCQLNDSPG
jgi:DNA-binding HxlR family transcriptional regulator